MHSINEYFSADFLFYLKSAYFYLVIEMARFNNLVRTILNAM